MEIPLHIYIERKREKAKRGWLLAPKREPFLDQSYIYVCIGEFFYEPIYEYGYGVDFHGPSGRQTME